MKTEYAKEFVQLFEDGDENVRAFLADLLICFLSCGDEFIEEIQAVQGDAVAMRAVVDKWLPTNKTGRTTA